MKVISLAGGLAESLAGVPFLSDCLPADQLCTSAKHISQLPRAYVFACLAKEETWWRLETDGSAVVGRGRWAEGVHVDCGVNFD